MIPAACVRTAVNRVIPSVNHVTNWWNNSLCATALLWVAKGERVFPTSRGLQCLKEKTSQPAVRDVRARVCECALSTHEGQPTPGRVSPGGPSGRFQLISCQWKGWGGVGRAEATAAWAHVGSSGVWGRKLQRVLCGRDTGMVWAVMKGEDRGVGRARTEEVDS